MVKVRIGSEKQLHEFSEVQEAFDWVRETQTPWVEMTQTSCVFSILIYERGELDSMDRWFFDGVRFVRENIQS